MAYDEKAPGPGFVSDVVRRVGRDYSYSVTVLRGFADRTDSRRRIQLSNVLNSEFFVREPLPTIRDLSRESFVRTCLGTASDRHASRPTHMVGASRGPEPFLIIIEFPEARTED